MARAWRYAAQLALYAGFAIVVGYFASAPVYTHIEPEKAVIRVTFSHPGQPRSECRRLSQEELEKLPPNMRRPLDCPRQRVPLLLELVLDGEVLYRDWLPPTGLSGDGAATAYERFVVEPGSHHLIARLRDSRRKEDFDYESEINFELAKQQNFVIDFRAETGGFQFLSRAEGV